MNIELIIAGVIVLIVVVGLIGWIVGVYNGLVMLRNDVDKAFANIDVLLKQRADQIPDLMRVVQVAMNHENALFTRLSEARLQYLQASSLNDKVEGSNQLNNALKSVMAVAENYPTLISGPNMVALQQAISAVEERIADRREFFNESVNLYNIGIATFPDLFFARMLGYQRTPLLVIGDTEKRYDGVKLEIPVL
ncbi:LemA protein [Pseudomonas sp. 3296]|uniref:LemA family protein n=1 Tax=Pseudomonas sp. 3296 TaxID=2817753 RepID=UPI00286324D4|nr:LemA family protein [Pseudomonas sp. 3296]MDR6917503.1 LemA protein [Pseudomonas sp. 3296]